jgi:hypothetical protein
MQATLKKYNPDEKAVDPADGDFEKIFGGGSSPKQSTEKTAEDIEHDIKKRQVEKFQELLRDKVFYFFFALIYSIIVC